MKYFTRLVREHSLVALEDLNVANMAKNHVAAGLAETENGRGERVSRVVSMGTGVPFVEASTTGISRFPRPLGRGGCQS